MNHTKSYCLGILACALLLSALATGCAKSVDRRADPAWSTCQADQDCAVVELACCDHCNGGELGAFNRASLERATKALAPAVGACNATVCTERKCNPGAARCEQGRCAVIKPQ